jgi:acetolactate synthase-1/2/3 large subunit
MHESDFILAIGVRFDDRVTGKLAEFCPHATIVHIDIDPASISKTVKVDVPIVGDVKLVLKQMLSVLKEHKKKPSKKETHTDSEDKVTFVHPQIRFISAMHP